MKFTLSPAQAHVHERVSDSEHRITILSGAVRSGKSHVGIDAWLEGVMRRHRGQQFVVAAQTVALVRDNLVPKLEEAAAERGAATVYRPSKSDLLIGDNQFLLRSGKDKRSRTLIQGLTLAGAYADEAVNLSPDFVQELNGRCSVEDSRLLLNCNPTYPGHWLKREWIDNAHNLGIQHMTLTIYDNPGLPESYIREQIVTRTGADRARAIFGEWVAEAGLVWPHWRLDEPPEGAPSGWYLGVDYGEAEPTHAVLFGVWDGIAYAVDEWRWAHRERGQISPDEQVDGIRAMVAGREVWAVAVDPHAFSIKPSLKKAWPRRVHDARNDLDQTISYAGALLTSGRVRLTPNVPHCIREIGNYRWKTPTELGTSRESPIDYDNHGMDALRYFCSTLYAGAVGGRRRELRKVGSA